MNTRITTMQESLKATEEIFFLWLFRVSLVGALIGSAWIDDAPPLEIAVFLIGIYTAIRVILQVPRFADLSPFSNRALSYLFAGFLFILLALVFLVVVSLVDALVVAAVE